MLPLSYLAIPLHLTLPDEITDQILRILDFLSQSRLAAAISHSTFLLRASSPSVLYMSPDQRLALFLILAAAHEDPGLVHHHRRKAIWVYEEAVLSADEWALGAVGMAGQGVGATSSDTSHFQDGSNRLSSDASYWGDDWGLDPEVDGGREVREWINGVGDMLNDLARYQEEVQMNVLRSTSTKRVDGKEGLERRVECRRKIVEGVGAWFGRVDAATNKSRRADKTVSFAVQDEVVQIEQDLLDGYDSESDFLYSTQTDGHFISQNEPLDLPMPPSVFTAAEPEGRASIDTIWPTAGDRSGSAYEDRPTPRNEFKQNDVMDIEWPVPGGGYAVRSPETSPRPQEADHLDQPHPRASQWPGYRTPPAHRPTILYNDPDIFQSLRPSTGDELARRHHRPWTSPKHHEWPLITNHNNLGYQKQKDISSSPTSVPLSNWPLNEHHTPTGISKNKHQADPLTLPFQYPRPAPLSPIQGKSSKSYIHPDQSAIQTFPKQTSSAEPPLPVVPPSGPALQNHPRAASSPSEIFSDRLQAHTRAPVSEEAQASIQSLPPLRPTLLPDEDRVVADPVLMESGIWKMLK